MHSNANGSMATMQDADQSSVQQAGQSLEVVAVEPDAPPGTPYRVTSSTQVTAHTKAAWQARRIIQQQELQQLSPAPHSSAVASHDSSFSPSQSPATQPGSKALQGRKEKKGSEKSERKEQKASQRKAAQSKGAASGGSEPLGQGSDPKPRSPPPITAMASKFDALSMLGDD